MKSVKSEGRSDILGRKTQTRVKFVIQLTWKKLSRGHNENEKI